MARKLIVEIVGDSRSYERALGRSAKATNTFGKNLERTVRGGAVATVGFRGLGRSVAFASAAFLGGAGLTKAITSSISEASDLNEEINKAKVVFDQSAATIIAWSKTTATSFGISQKAALGAAGGFGAMLETAGLTSDQAAVFSRRLVELGSDIASFNNISVDEALLKLKSGLAGEAEPLRTVGVLLSEARVKQEAYRLGLAKAGATLTEQQKVQARYSLILKDTSRQQGDFSRTSGGLANQQRILAAQVTNLQAKLGAELLPVTLDIVRALNRWLGDTEKQEQAQKLLAEAVKNGRAAFQSLREIIVPLAHGVKELSDFVGGARNAIKLLIAVMVVGKVVSFTGAITGLSSEMLVAEGRAVGLRAALLRLGAIGVIALGVEVIINRKSIDDKVQGFLKSHDATKFLASGGGLKIDATTDTETLRRARDHLIEIGKGGDIAVTVLNRVIARFKELDAQTFTKAEGQLARLRNRINDTKGRKVTMEVVEKGLEQFRQRLAEIKDKKSLEYRVIQKGLEELRQRLAGIKGRDVRMRIIAEGLDGIQDRIDVIHGKKVVVDVVYSSSFIGPIPPGAPVVGSGSSQRDRGFTITPEQTNAAAAGGQAAVDRIVGQAGRSLNQQLADSVTRAEHLKDLLRADPDNATLQKRLTDELTKQAQLRKDISSAAKSAATAAKDAAKAAREHTLAVFDVAEAQAGLTKSLKDDLAVAKQRETKLRQMVALNKKDLDLAQALTAATAARRDIEQQIAEQRRARIQKAQFKALGLTAEGEKPAPSSGALLRRALTFEKSIKGTVLDTKKTRQQLRKIINFLKKHLHDAGREVRQAILGMLNDIDSSSDKKKGPLTATHGLASAQIVKNLGLTSQQADEIQRRLAHATTGGGRPIGAATGSRTSVAQHRDGGRPGDRIVVEAHTTVNIDGQKVANVVTRNQQKKKRRNPPQKRGPGRARR